MVKAIQIVILCVCVFLLLASVGAKGNTEKIIYASAGSFLGLVAVASAVIMEVCA